MLMYGRNQIIIYKAIILQLKIKKKKKGKKQVRSWYPVLGFKVTVKGYCSHEIFKDTSPWKQTYDKPR